MKKVGLVEGDPVIRLLVRVFLDDRNAVVGCEIGLEASEGFRGDRYEQGHCRGDETKKYDQVAHSTIHDRKPSRLKRHPKLRLTGDDFSQRTPS